MEKLTTSDHYQTEKRKVSFIARKLPALFFYTKMVRTVFKASALAKKGKFSPDAFVEASLDMVRHLEGVGANVTVEHMEKFQKLDGPCVFVGNHMSTLETFVLPCIILPFKKVNFVIKESLYHYPVFKHVMRYLKPISVTRTNPREDLKTMMTEGMKNLEAGISVIVFPQTTRRAGFDSAGFNSIGTKLASRAGVPVIPVALRTDAWGNGKRLKDFGKISPQLPIRFTFGDPIPVTGNGKEEQVQVVQFLETHLTDWFSQS